MKMKENVAYNAERKVVNGNRPKAKMLELADRL